MSLIEGIRRVMASTFWFIVVGPLAGTVVFLAIMTVAMPHEIKRILSVLPLVIMGAYIVGAIPAGLTGMAIGVLSLSRIRFPGASFAVGAASTALFLQMDTILRQGMFWPDRSGWYGPLQNALWGGLSALLTAWLVAKTGSTIRETLSLYRRSVPAD